MTTRIDGETSVIDKTDLQEPGKYNVIFLNDDYTPMQFVVEVLTNIFHHTEDTAIVVMMLVHEEGRGVAGTYPFEIAEQKAAETHGSAQQQGHPLRVKVEPE